MAGIGFGAPHPRILGPAIDMGLSHAHGQS